MEYVLDLAYQHDQEPRNLRTREEVEAFVDELATLGPAYAAATAYAVEEGSELLPDHELLIGVSGRTGLGAVRYSGADGTWYLRGERVNPGGVSFAYFGTAQEFPSDAEVPLAVVREALWGLLVSRGGKPGGMAWSETD
ncbi:Imm1 family immunity protein [Umezawaea sp. Da 62-37]|uniref:Imm1 family immunity protein n=1 Tax=Umezawaea sp. Da 62-37 TaxID=3075927 RepID=UPI0028F6C5AE|nr:Imm1 family immunity protein [Umezawaea sp. Da 62-37]WNV82291.1 Imm1 family immunity protein [Umezawaea sp. Da 62-37]